MSTIHSILAEELERLTQLQKRYLDEFRSLPSGSLSIKKRKGSNYAYLSYRDNEKIKTDYIGPADSEKVKEVEKQISKRKELKELIKTTQQRIKEIKKAL